MSQHFQRCADAVSELLSAIDSLQQVVAQFELAPLNEREWYELLKRKLQPQLGCDAFLVVAVVGGTNIGKSVVFNHIAGDRISSTSPMASGTKHPTALLPVGFAENIDLEEQFPGFTLTPWTNADQALSLDERHLLFWQESEAVAPNLVVLDTPDVDSVAEVNWERADHIRQSADVLVGVLTQQKYNDAAVKQFFRKAAAEDKVVVIVFNQCLLPEDEEYWPLWVGTFCEETRVVPHAVYISPNDRRAAEANALPFYERPWPRPAEYTPPEHDSPLNLMQELAHLKFGEIKMRTLQGALKSLVDVRMGVPSWLSELEQRAAEFQEALNTLSAQRLVEIERWPTAPNPVLIQRIRHWWATQREGWTSHVHGFYNRLGEVVAYPLNAVRGKEEQVDPLADYRTREWETILDVVDRALTRLTRLRDLKNPLLSPKLEKILEGGARESLILKLREAHEQVDLGRELDLVIEHNLATFKEDNPQSYRLFRNLDSFAAAARPAVSVGFFMTGAGPMGDVLGATVANSALSGMLNLVGDAIGGTVATAVGDKLVTDGASHGAGYLEARFRQLHTAFAKQRANWVAEQLEQDLFGGLPAELAESARIPMQPEFTLVRKLTDQLRSMIS